MAARPRENKDGGARKDTLVLELRRENEELKRILKRYRRELQKYTDAVPADAEDETGADAVVSQEDPSEYVWPKCPKCKSKDVGHFVTPSGVKIFVCGYCHYRQRVL